VSASLLREHARAIWQAAVDAVRPEPLLRHALLTSAMNDTVTRGARILVVGAGKAGAAMSAAVENVLSAHLDRMDGFVNVPAGAVRPLRRIHLHAARPSGSNQPTAQGVAGTRRILELVAAAGPEDVCLCLLSGGGSALLPAPAPGLTLDDKQQVTLLLHRCGATIHEMNAVRKHLSAVKGGRLAQAFAGQALGSLIISDVVGDPLDVIASGPTAPDPTTYADALAVCERHGIAAQVPGAVLAHLRQGAAGKVSETPKTLPANITNQIIGNNALALAAARRKAEALGYRVLNLGSHIEGETRHVATAMAGLVTSVRLQQEPLPPPACLLSGGETTVTLAPKHGQGGRNQEFVLAAALKLGREGLRNVALLSGGTDGEDGPTDAAGAVADDTTLVRAEAFGLDPADVLARNDSYHLFARTGDLLKTGLTETNVMDVRVMLVG
jgi:hydroxypyruvate reductase/glycerate 2-kinase